MVVKSLPLPKPRVAVYGSLRHKGTNHIVMEQAGGKFLGSYWTTPDFTMHDLNAFPAVTLNGSQSIFLEVYEVQAMGPIDHLEGYPDFYLRKQISTPYGKAWLYFMLAEELDLSVSVVPSGNWMKHIGVVV